MAYRSVDKVAINTPHLATIRNSVSQLATLLEATISAYRPRKKATFDRGFSVFSARKCSRANWFVCME